MNYQQVNIDPSTILAAILENLNIQFYADNRDRAKRFYSSLEKGETISFMKIQTPESGDIECQLKLDASLYNGSLNYSRFRKNMAMMMVAIKNRIENNEPLGLFTSESGHEILFNIPGILRTDEGTNAMVCSMNQGAPGLMLIQLMFIDPEQYLMDEKET